MKGVEDILIKQVTFLLCFQVYLIKKKIGCMRVL